MKQLKIGIFGATGLVGMSILDCLERLELPVEELRLFASQKSKDKIVHFKGNQYIIEELTKERLYGLDVLFGAVDETISRLYSPIIRESKVLYIDNSSAFRLDKQVPLVIPEINIQDVSAEHQFISNPNCSTIIALMALYPIHQLGTLKRIIVSTYQAVSGAGQSGMHELELQLNDYPDYLQHQCVFQQPILNNCIASIGTLKENGHTSEELKMTNEARKILHLDHLEVSCTCVRIPVLRSHSISIYCETEELVNFEQLKEFYKKMKGIKWCDDIPSPYLASEQFDILVGRLRRDLNCPNGILLWCSGDQIYKGAALNAVQIAQSLLI